VARILIVDDDPQVRLLLRLFLEGYNHEVFDAPDGRGGLRLAEQVRVDAFFCDVFMDDQDGFETMRAFRAAFPGVPVVAVSGGGFGGMLDLLPTARRLGADRVLYKPFNQANLLSLLDEILPAPQESGVSNQ
jgi:CheY-like chemotaxis protein